MKKLIVLTLGLTSLLFGSCGQINCGCQNQDNKEIKCENKNSCKENCSNKTEEFKCGLEKMYQNDMEKTISNTNEIVNKAKIN